MNRLLAKNQLINAGAMLACDSLVLLSGLYLGDLILHYLHGLPVSSRYSLTLVPVWWMAATAIRITPGWGLGPVEELRRIQILLLTVFGMAGIAVFLSRGYVVPSRIVYLFSYLFSAVFIPLVRLPVKKILLRTGNWGCPAVLYGNAAQLENMIDTFRRNPLLGYIPCGVFTDDGLPGVQRSGIPVLGGLAGKTSAASVAVVSVACAESGGFDRTFSDYQRVVLLPDIKEDMFLWAVPRTLGGLIGLEVTSNLLNPVARIAKRSMDMLLIIITVPVWLPLLVLITLWIGIAEHQNPFFLQHRIGKANRPFRPVKFRTMRVDADKGLEQTLAADEGFRQEWAQNCKLRNDPRVTPIGRILRRTSLDELPQILNVIAGQMSLVGPRPLPDYHHEMLAESARTPRSRVRPGITGLWQVSGRSESGTAGMEKWDTYYVRNWSVWLDVIILFRTLAAVVKGQGAY